MNLRHFSLLLLILSSLFTGCATKSYDLESAEGLYESGMEDVTKERFVQGIEKLRKVQSKHPYSKFATLARLALADAYFKQAAYEEAAAAYEVFQDLHPKHEKAEYAQFRIGESYEKAAPSHIARDQQFAQQALSAFEVFLLEHPQSPLAKDAKEHVRAIREKLAGKELYIAKFYKRTKAPKSALGRLKKIESEYGDTLVAKEAEKERVKIEQKLKDSD